MVRKYASQNADLFTNNLLKGRSKIDVSVVPKSFFSVHPNDSFIAHVLLLRKLLHFHEDLAFLIPELCFWVRQLGL